MKKHFIPILTLFISCQSLAYQVNEVNIPSKLMGISKNAMVVTPDSYDGTKKFPVVYLLHGYSGSYADWTKNTDVEHFSDLYNIILVMPDGDFDKWYVDSPINDHYKYQSYVGEEVVNYIDQNYKTIEKKAGRAITGLSMGGFGAFNLAMNYRNTFGNVGSISGAVDPQKYLGNDWGVETVLGKPVPANKTWEERSIIANANKFLHQDINITFECGVDDFFSQDNRDLHNRLLKLRINHDYSERPGEHNWEYWNNAIQYQLKFFSDKFVKYKKYL